MKARDEAKYDMFVVVHSVVNSQQAAWTSNAAFVRNWNTFTTQFDHLKDLVDRERSGVSEEKAKALRKMVELTYPIGAAVAAYAAEQGDFDLAAKVQFSRSELQFTADRQSLDRCRSIATAVSALPTEVLADLEITEAMITASNAAIEQFEKLRRAPRARVASESAARKERDKTFAAIDQILKERLDNLMPLIAIKHPAFGDAYRRARVIVDRPTSRRSPSEEAAEEPPPPENPDEPAA